MLGPLVWTAYYAIGPVTDAAAGMGPVEVYRANAWSFYLWLIGLLLLGREMQYWFLGMNVVYLMILVLMIWNYEDDGNLPRAALLHKGMKLHGAICIAACVL